MEFQFNLLWARGCHPTIRLVKTHFDLADYTTHLRKTSGGISSGLAYFEMSYPCPGSAGSSCMLRSCWARCRSTASSGSRRPVGPRWARSRCTASSRSRPIWSLLGAEIPPIRPPVAISKLACGEICEVVSGFSTNERMSLQDNLLPRSLGKKE